MSLPYNSLSRQILHGDILEKIKEIPDESIDCIITSPPYWGLRDYEVEGQIGLEPDFREFLKTMQKVMNECRRVLKPSGSCWVDFGDTYAGSGKGAGGDPTKCKESSTFTKKPNIKETIQAKSLIGIPARFYIQCIDDGWIARNFIPWIKENHMPSSVKDRFTNKWESVFFFVKNNKTKCWRHKLTNKWYWSKPQINYFDNSQIGKNWRWEYRERKNLKINEYVSFSKRISLYDGFDYYFDLDAVREKPKKESKPFSLRVRENKHGRAQTKISGSMSEKEDKEYNSKGEIKEKYSDNPQSNVARPHRDRPGNPDKTCAGFNERWKNNKRPNNDDFENGKWRKHYDESGNCLGCGKHWSKHTVSDRAKGSMHEASKRTENIVWCNPKGKNPGDIFFVNPKPFPEAHFATFPVELPLKILKCSCPQDGIVLDPFFGAGTTAVAAEKLGLKWIGIELNEEYISIARKRLEPYLNDKLGVFC